MKLGLIGGNIAASRAPSLHGLAGRQFGIDVTYDLLTPDQMGKDFDTVFANCRARGYRGINITYPYKEIAAAGVRIDDAGVRAIGAVNTITFEPDGPRGFNTDYSGFVAAFRATFGDMPMGRVCMVGAGGVGKAVAFGLATLGVAELRLFDRDVPRATALADRLRAAVPGGDIAAVDSLDAAVAGAAGFINCTPVLGAAEAEGLTIMSGYELFFHQGLDAWEIFSGRTVDAARLRADLHATGTGAAA